MGGTGIISSACAELCVDRGFELTLLTRGQSHRPSPDGANSITADIRVVDEVETVLSDQTFDVVVDWIAFHPNQVENDIELFKGKTSQYVFISSASVYQKPPEKLPITESTPLSNPFWRYSRDKIACEERLRKAFQENGFPVTIVRPSHTYDKTYVPLKGSYTAIDRMRKGKKVIIHGDGTSLWTLTHHQDFAKGFVGLLGNANAIGESYHITSDEFQTWNQICETLADAAGVEPKIAHIPSDSIAKFNEEWGASLLGDKAHSLIFDNSKIKAAVPNFEALIPFSEGAREIMDWYDADSSRKQVNVALDRMIDDLIEKVERIPFWKEK